MITKHAKANVWILTDGTQTRHPPRDEALRLGKIKYCVDERCDKCAGSRIRYIEGDRCHGCEQLLNILFFNAVKYGWPGIITEDLKFHNGYSGQYDKPLDRELMLRAKRAYDKFTVADPSKYRVSDHQCKFGHVGIRDFTTHKCIQCSESPRQQALEAGEKWYTPKTPCKKCDQLSPRYVSNGKCSTCVSEVKESPRQQAIEAGDKWYAPLEPCKKCDTISRRRVNNGECSKCTSNAVKPPKETPRKKAIEAGEKWYTPVEPCINCHTLALRRVNNGECSGCQGGEDRRKTAESIMMGENPDLILSKADASLAGLKVYRTGIACLNGHAVYRYVSTGHCIQCVNG